MKPLFFLLAFANIVFFLWANGMGRTPTREEQILASGLSVERLVLLKELPEPALAQAEKLSAPDSPPHESVAPAERPKPDFPAEPIPEPAAAEKPEAPQETCRRLGPYASPQQAQAAAQAFGGQARLVKKPTPVETGYAILYPSAGSLEAAQANRKMLMEKGFKDVWLVDKGDNQYAISLAVVSRKDRAEAALARIVAQGVVAEIKPRRALAERWWLEIRDTAGTQSMAAPGLELKDCD
ncbi:MAG: hypothetical protein ACKN9T_15240 [Candidatus Methylumidiphilus sp.]